MSNKFVSSMNSIIMEQKYTPLVSIIVAIYNVEKHSDFYGEFGRKIFSKNRNNLGIAI